MAIPHRAGWGAVSVALVVTLLGAGPARSGVPESVAVEDSEFVPDDVSVPLAGSVRWTWEEAVAEHNVREDHKLFRSGDPVAGPDETFERTFSAGTFHYYCEPHGDPAGGMDGRVRVQPAVAASPDGLPFTVRWATVDTQTGTAFDVRFRVGSGDWRTWLTDTVGRRRVFGKDGKPVRVHAGTMYSFQVRSQKNASTPNAVSRYSPAESFTP
jgi:plastocyanin